jgi:hypothetical protein
MQRSRPRSARAFAPRSDDCSHTFRRLLAYLNEGNQRAPWHPSSLRSPRHGSRPSPNMARVRACGGTGIGPAPGGTSKEEAPVPTKTMLSDAERQGRREADREKAAQAVEALTTSEGWQAWLGLRRHFRTYSANNQFLIALQRWGSHYLLGRDVVHGVYRCGGGRMLTGDSGRRRRRWTVCDHASAVVRRPCSSGCSWMRSPRRRPWVTWIAWRWPRRTWLSTVWRETPSRAAASARRT